MAGKTEATWISPDQAISKHILLLGKNGIKPSEDCECLINICETEHDVQKYNDNPVIIGDSCDDFERLLDIVLTMMNVGEQAKVIFKLKDCQLTMILELKSFKTNGFIFEWSAVKKFELSSRHKTIGVELFQNNRYADASHRFSKAIKLLASIPIAVDEPPVEMDGILISEVYSLKMNLYNNLASCYLKHERYDTVIELCKKVLKEDGHNLKALYKLAVAYYNVNDHHIALETLQTLLKLDPGNKTAADKLKDVLKKVNESNTRVNTMIKKMFN